MTRALELIRTATHKLRNENMMQFLPFAPCTPNLLFLFWVLKSTLKKEKQPTCHEPAAKSPNISWLSWRSRHDFQLSRFTKISWKSSETIDSRLYTNMKVQLFVAALIAGNFVCGPPRGMGRWKDEKRDPGLFRVTGWNTQPSYVGITIKHNGDPYHNRRVFFVAHVWCFFCEKSLSYCLECVVFFGGCGEGFLGTEWRDVNTRGVTTLPSQISGICRMCNNLNHIPNNYHSLNM